MSENYTVQVSTKLIDGTMLNVRGTDVGAVLADVRQLAESGGDLQESLAVLQAAGRAVVASNPDAAPAAAPAPSGWTPPQGQPAASLPGAAPSCQHGVRVLKETKNGKKVWECAGVAANQLKWNDAGACKGTWVN